MDEKAVNALIQAALVPYNAEIAMNNAKIADLKVREEMYNAEIADIKVRAEMNNAEIADLNVRVEMNNAKIADLKVCVEMLEEDICVFAPDKVRNMSAQILLFYCGDHPVQQDRLDKRRKHFQEMEDGQAFGFNETFNGLEDYTTRRLTTDEWAAKFDKMIDKGDGVIHFSDWNSLYNVVVSVRGLLIRHPKLQYGLEDEVWVINHFEMLRAKQLSALGVAKAGKRAAVKRLRRWSGLG